MDDYVKSTPLISSGDVNGNPVVDPSGAKIGEIDHLMIERETGQVAYASVGFGGFLGLGKDHYPVPWKRLSYDPSLGAYRTDITEEEVKGAPEPHDEWYSDRQWEQRAHDHFGVPYYWF